MQVSDPTLTPSQINSMITSLERRDQELRRNIDRLSRQLDASSEEYERELQNNEAEIQELHSRYSALALVQDDYYYLYGRIIETTAASISTMFQSIVNCFKY